LFTVATERGRARLLSLYPYIGIAVAGLIVLPHALWLSGRRVDFASVLGNVTVLGSVRQWVTQLATLIVAHAGLWVLVIVAGALAADRRAAVPELVRQKVDPFARTFVYAFALAPALLATLATAVFGQPAPLGGAGALIVLSGLAVIILAGDVIALHRQSATGWTWVALL